MNLPDLIDVAGEVLPRRWKRTAAAAVIVGFLIFPNPVGDALVWYGQQRAQQIIDSVTEPAVVAD